MFTYDDVGNSLKISRISFSFFFLSSGCTICKSAPKWWWKTIFNQIPSCRRRRHQVKEIHSLSYFFSLNIYRVELLLVLFVRYSFFSLFFLLLALFGRIMISRHRLPRHHAEVNYRGTIRHCARQEKLTRALLRFPRPYIYYTYVKRTNVSPKQLYSVILQWFTFDEFIYIIKLFYYLIVSRD